MTMTKNTADNGKGDKLRKGADLKTYRDNYDAIFRKRKPARRKSK